MKPAPAAITEINTSVSAHRLLRRRAIPAGARQRHPDDGDMSCAGGAGTPGRVWSSGRIPQTPARDPLTYYGLPPEPRLEYRARAGRPGRQWRGGLVTSPSRSGRAIGPRRADMLLTRDLGVASAAARDLPRRLRPPLVYESHGYAPDVAAALPDLVATATPPSPRKLRRLASARGARLAGGGRVCHDYRGPSSPNWKPGSARGRGSRSFRMACASPRPGPIPGAAEAPIEPVVAYAGHLYAWKGVDVLLEALRALPDARGLIVGGHREGTGSRANAGAGRERSGIGDRVTFTGLVEPARVRGAAARRPTCWCFRTRRPRSPRDSRRR